jgi:subtilisin family serine protease
MTIRSATDLPEYSTIKDSSMVANQKEYKYFLFIQNKHVEDSISRISTIQYVENTLQKFETADSLIKKRDSKQVIYLSDATSFTPTDSAEADIKKFALDMFVVMPSGKSLRDYINDGESFLNRFKGMQSLAGNEGKLRKEIIGDDPYNINDRDYGNNIVGDTIIDHGTQCSGIIAAIRNNGVGMDGVSDNVQIMSVRAAKKGGDEWDKDIALAIRYAVDNGAKIISMSFGKKPLSPQKKWVDEAIEYAEKNNVLLIHGSGNDHDNIDSVKYYPNDDLLDSLRSVNNFINVGAIKMDDSLTLSTSFSNYGQKNVDVFAPGEDIYSTIAANKYNFDSGTSLAAPVVAGVAALILEYYPKLKAEQLKDIIMKSVTSLKGKMVYKPGTEEKVDFSTLCVSGGVVNAYKALQLAAEITSHKKANM